MTLFYILLVVFALIVFIIWQIKRAKNFKKNDNQAQTVELPKNAENETIMKSYLSTVADIESEIKKLSSVNDKAAAYEKIIQLSEQTKESLKSLPYYDNRHVDLQQILEIRREASISKNLL